MLLFSVAYTRLHRSVYPSIRPSVPLLKLFPKSYLTRINAHPYATDVVVYKALFTSPFLTFFLYKSVPFLVGGDDRVFTLLVRGRESFELLKRIRDSITLSKMASNDQLDQLQVRTLDMSLNRMPPFPRRWKEEGGGVEGVRRLGMNFLWDMV